MLRSPTCVLLHPPSANILLDDGLKPKLCDFGTAHLRPHSVTQSGIVTTVTGSRGTLGYLPEEYIRGGRLSVRVDVYSLGVVSGLLAV